MIAKAKVQPNDMRAKAGVISARYLVRLPESIIDLVELYGASCVLMFQSSHRNEVQQTSGQPVSAQKTVGTRIPAAIELMADKRI